MPITHPWHEVSPGSEVPEVVQCIIEIPQGSRAKYEIDKETGLLRLDRVLYSSVTYPVNYGIIPRTLFVDGDPLDVLVISSVSIEHLALVNARVIGVMRMTDNGVGDDKIVAVALQDAPVQHITDMQHVPAHWFAEVENFFETYKRLERKEVSVGGFDGREAAYESIRSSLALYLETFPERA